MTESQTSNPSDIARRIRAEIDGRSPRAPGGASLPPAGSGGPSSPPLPVWAILGRCTANCIDEGGTAQ
jgi:hypothetical protein